MSEILELNREEITRLSNILDSNGHAWALYLTLKKSMDLYTGLVHINQNILVQVLSERINFNNTSSRRATKPLEQLLMLLIDAEVISDYLSTKDIVSVKLPLALSDTCLENRWQH
ncbi:MAG: hypothetical protein KBD64_06510 [Gammaproteobacteria bacterium]|nr:hypothetical protein [Gammaproteobacteria bacterium]